MDFLLFVLKTIPRQFALFEFQENLLGFINSIFLMLESLCEELITFCVRLEPRDVRKFMQYSYQVFKRFV